MSSSIEPLNSGAVWRANGAHGDQRAFEQLDAFVLEGAECHQLVVLRAAQWANDFSG